MKTYHKRHLPSLFGSLLTLSSLPLSAGVSVTGFDWSGGDETNAGGNAYYTGTGAPGATTTYAGLVENGGGNYAFGLIKEVPTGTTDYNAPSTWDVTGKDGATGSFTVDFAFDGNTRFSHLAYTGSALQGYEYKVTEAGVATLSVTMSASTVAESATTGTAGTTMLGLSLSTYELGDLNPVNFGGTVMRSNMWWGDIKPLDSSTGYGAADFKSLEQLGANFDGKNGVSVDFNFYAAMDVIRDNVHITSLDDMTVAINKLGDQTLTPDIGITYYTNGVDPIDDPERGIDNSYLDAGTHGGASTYNFGAAGGEDNYVDVSFSNDQWSDGNIGFTTTPVPEPSVSMLAAVCCLGWLTRRKR